MSGDSLPFGLGKKAGDMATSIAGGTPPTPPPTPIPPDPNQATTDALNKQLSQEVQMRASRSLYSGSGGLLDAKTPPVASQVLLGN